MRLKPKNSWEKLIGSVALARIYEVLLCEEEPIHQSDLSRMANVSPQTVSRILGYLSRDPILSKIFIREKPYDVVFYSMNKEHPAYEALKQLYEMTKGQKSI